MTTANRRDDWNFEEEHHCAHCLTELDRWDTRCYRCNATFHGEGRFDLVAGQPHIASLLFGS
jgi:hypothetical protein